MHNVVSIMKQPADTDSDPALQGLIGQYLDVLDEDIDFAFQPIVSDVLQDVIGFEALVRGSDSGSAADIIERVRPEDRFAFDQACRIRAIEAAARFEIDGNLHLNCTAVHADNIERVGQVTRVVAERHDLPVGRIVLELSSLDAMGDTDQLASVRETAQDAGFRVLLDNFGLADADLARMARFRPDWLKLDRRLIAGIDHNRTHQAIVRGVLRVCKDLGIQVMAGGVETARELEWLRQTGLECFQGYFFTRPELGTRSPSNGGTVVRGAYTSSFWSGYEWMTIGWL